jgi:RNA polymerase sigma-70 factor (ECF subfamily)
MRSRSDSDDAAPGALESTLAWASSDARPLGSRGQSALPLHDPQRLGELLEGLQPRLTAVALRITKHPESARDVVQNAFEKVIRHGNRFEGQSLVSTWVHRIVVNEALMWLRSQHRRIERQHSFSEVDATEVRDPAPGPAERLYRRERAGQLYEGLAQLAAEERDVVLHCALDGESYAEYSARTGTHPAAVKSRAFRARRRLGGLLGGSVAPRRRSADPPAP